MKRKISGWEGNPLSSYHWGQLAAALLPGLVMAGLIEIYRLTLRVKPVDLSHLPSDAILYGYHVDLYPTCVHRGYLRQYPGRGYLLGSHTFLSYLMNVGFWLGVPGMQIHRYDPSHRGGKARGWTAEDLKKNTHLRMGIFTDSGGPYERVRPSISELARLTGRPCVAIRIRASRAIRIRHHYIPLPGARIEVRISPVITPADATPVKLQEVIDALDSEAVSSSCLRIQDRAV